MLRADLGIQPPPRKTAVIADGRVVLTPEEYAALKEGIYITAWPDNMSTWFEVYLHADEFFPALRSEEWSTR
jgi:hypothetical protein